MSAPRVASAPLAPWVISLAACCAAGCAANTHYVRPADPTQTQYLPPGSAQLADAAAVGVPHVTLGNGPPQQWWTLLGSADIDRLVMRALQNNQSLAEAKAHLTAAQEHLRAARGAWYPQVDAAAGDRKSVV